MRTDGLFLSPRNERQPYLLVLTNGRDGQVVVAPMFVCKEPDIEDICLMQEEVPCHCVFPLSIKEALVKLASVNRLNWITEQIKSYRNHGHITDESLERIVLACVGSPHIAPAIKSYL